jgi:hypothetical protein
MTPHSGPWFSRAEAATHLRISVRQLDRLRFPRSYIGRRALYSRETLDAHLLSNQTTPPPKPQTSNVAPLPFSLPRLRRGGRESGAAWLDDIRAVLATA